MNGRELIKYEKGQEVSREFFNSLKEAIIDHKKQVDSFSERQKKEIKFRIVKKH